MFYNETGFGVPFANTLYNIFWQYHKFLYSLVYASLQFLTWVKMIVQQLRKELASDYHGCHRIIARYVKQKKEEGFVTKIIEAIRKIDPDESLSESLTGKHITYVLSRQSIRPEPNSFLLKKILIDFQYIFLENISSQLYGNWDIPINDVTDMGIKIAMCNEKKEWLKNIFEKYQCVQLSSSII